MVRCLLGSRFHLSTSRNLADLVGGIWADRFPRLRRCHRSPSPSSRLVTPRLPLCLFERWDWFHDIAVAFIRFHNVFTHITYSRILYLYRYQSYESYDNICVQPTVNPTKNMINCLGTTEIGHTWETCGSTLGHCSVAQCQPKRARWVGTSCGQRCACPLGRCKIKDFSVRCIMESWWVRGLYWGMMLKTAYCIYICIFVDTRKCYNDTKTMWVCTSNLYNLQSKVAYWSANPILNVTRLLLRWWDAPHATLDLWQGLGQLGTETSVQRWGVFHHQ